MGGKHDDSCSVKSRSCPQLFKQVIKNTEKKLYFLFQILHALLKIKTLYLNISIASCQFGGSKE